MKKILFVLFLGFILILSGCKPSSEKTTETTNTEKVQTKMSALIDADKICSYCGDAITSYYSKSTITTRIYHIPCIKISGLEERIKKLESVIMELQSETPEIPEKSNEPDEDGYYN